MGEFRYTGRNLRDEIIILGFGHREIVFWGLQEETVEHVPIYCLKYERERKHLIQKLGEINML